VRTEEHGSQGLDDGRYDTSLTQGQDSGADGRAEGVGHVIGSDADRQHERNDETDHDDPDHIRIHGHHRAGHGHPRSYGHSGPGQRLQRLTDGKSKVRLYYGAL